ncbi:MAG: hypothetical protein WCJ02_14945 [bacterium]
MANNCRFYLHVVGRTKKSIIDFYNVLSGAAKPGFYRTWNVVGCENMSVVGQLANQEERECGFVSAYIEGIVAWTMYNWFHCDGCVLMPCMCKRFQVSVEAFAYDSDGLDSQEHFIVDYLGNECVQFQRLPWSPKTKKKRGLFGGVDIVFNGCPWDGEGGFCQEWQKWNENTSIP